MTQPTHFVNSRSHLPEYGEVVVPSDDPNDDFDTPFCALWVGIAGDIAIVQMDGTTVAFTNVPASRYFVFRGVRVAATGTDADELVAVW